LNRCEFVFTGSAGILRRLDRVFVGTLVSSASGDDGAPSALELEYPESELELELLLDPELPASLSPPGAAGFTSPELDDEDGDDDPGCSPGYGNCCAGFFGACGASVAFGAFGVPGAFATGFGAVVSPGYGNCCVAFDGTGWSCAVGQFDVDVFPPSPQLVDPEQFIFCCPSGVLPSGVCFHCGSFAWLAGVCAHARPTPSPTTHPASHSRLIPLLDDTTARLATYRFRTKPVIPTGGFAKRTPDWKGRHSSTAARPSQTDEWKLSQLH
jgi:hypothetical protein